MPVANPQGPLGPDFQISINGTPLPVATAVHVTGVTVDDSVELPSLFMLELAGADDQDQPLAWIDDPTLFAIGHEVEIKLGYVDALDTLLKGEITALEPEFAFDRLPSLTVRGYDRRHRLQRGRKTQTFVQQKDSDIAAQIASAAGLTAQTEDSSVVHDYVLQANQTDLEFLQERARRIEYEVVVEDKTLFFRAVANAASEILTLTMADDLLEFYPCLSSAGQVSEVTVRGWSLKDKKVITSQAQAGAEVSTMGGQQSGAALVNSAFGTAVGLVSRRPVLTQAEADQLAKAHFNQLVLELIEGEGVCWGRTDLRAGKVIKITGVGQRFSGQYYVTAVIHRCTPQRGYQTHFTVRRNAA
jgi:phage protein D